LDSLWSVIIIIMLWTEWTAAFVAVRISSGAGPARRWTSRARPGTGSALGGGQLRGPRQSRWRDRWPIHAPTLLLQPCVHAPQTACDLAAAHDIHRVAPVRWTTRGDTLPQSASISSRTPAT